VDGLLTEEGSNFFHSTVEPLILIANQALGISSWASVFMKSGDRPADGFIEVLT
jgi:hypothetical protein